MDGRGGTKARAPEARPRHRARLISSTVLAPLVVAVAALGPVAAAPGAAASAKPPSAVDVAGLPAIASASAPVSPAPEVPTGRFDLPQPASPSLPPTKVPFDPQKATPVEELVGERGAHQEVWRNADGTRTLKQFDEPKYFQAPGATAWTPIDNTIIPDGATPGSFRNAANGWTVRFSPIGTDGTGGIQLTAGATTVAFAPTDAQASTPQVGTGDQANVITYPDIWPGVDARYTVRSGRVKEDLLLKRPTAQATFAFTTSGGTLAANADVPNGFDVKETIGEPTTAVRIAPPEVHDRDGKPLDHVAKPRQRASTATDAAARGPRGTNPKAAGKDEFAIDVDPAWVKGLTAEAFPIVIDPTLAVGADWWNTFSNTGWSCGTGCNHRLGNPVIPGSDTYYRSIIHFPYESLISNGQKVMSATLALTKVSGAGYDVGADVYWAGAVSWSAATSGGFIAGTNNFNTTASIDVSSFYADQVNRGATGAALGVVGDEISGVYTYKEFQADLSIVYDNPAPSPSASAPADGAVLTTTTPSLVVNPVTDADGEAVVYYFRLTTSADAESGAAVNSGWMTGTSWTVPAGSLRDGVTYWWHTYTFDGHWITVPTGSPRSLKVDLRLGSTTISPLDKAGPVAVNLATGNVTTSIATPTVPTVGGGMAVSFSYNSLASGSAGLTGSYWFDANGDRTFYNDGPALLVRTDPVINFDWGTGAPAPAMSTDNMLIHWDGYLTVPTTGSWQIGAISDDGARTTVDGQLLLNNWADQGAGGPVYGGAINLSAGQSKTIQIDYYDHFASAVMKLWAKGPGYEGEVPASWLSTAPSRLPQGWTMSVAGSATSYTAARVSDSSITLVTGEGRTFEYKKTTTGSSPGYTPPTGVDDVLTVAADGHIEVHADDGNTYSFFGDGRLDSIVSSVDDRHPAATIVHWTGNPSRVDYLQDPVSNQKLSLYYSGDARCGSPAPAGFDAAAPAGMLCLVSDDYANETKLWYLGGQLGRVENPGAALTDFGYSGNQLTAVRDALAADARAAGVRTDDASIKYDVAYTGGKATSVTAPAPRAGDARQQRSFAIGASQTDVTVSGVSGLPGYAGYGRRVVWDSAWRQTDDYDATGLHTITTWDAKDNQLSVTDPAGLKTTHIYDWANRRTDSYGPAPAAWFNADGTPIAAQAANVPHTHSGYDEGINTLAAAYWDNKDQSGAPKWHTTGIGGAGGIATQDWGANGPGGGLPADNWSLRLTGDLVFPANGAFVVATWAKGGVRIYIDDKLLADSWTDPGSTSTRSPDANFTETAAGTHHRLRVDFKDETGDAMMSLQWAGPGASGYVPGTATSPRYGLKTSTVDPDGKKVTTSYSDSSGVGPEFGLPTAVTVDPDAGGLQLTTTTTYETPGVGYLRTTSKTLPAGAATTVSDTYWGNTETYADPCWGGNSFINEAGRTRFSTAADPDGAGSASPKKNETVYDDFGRILATRVVNGTTTDPWTCHKYDARNREIQTNFPAWNGVAARTVTTNYAVGGDPTVKSVSDAAGTVTTKTDLLGRTIEYTDALGKKTTTTYDGAGNPTSQLTDNMLPVGRTFDAAGRMLTVTLNTLQVASATYDPATGRLASVSYPTGTGRAGNGTSGAFGYDTWGRQSSVAWSLGATSITSDAVTRSLGGRVKDETIDGTDAYPSGDNFTYDGASRLATARVASHTLTYNDAATNTCGINTAAGKNSNRTSVVDNATTTTYCYDNADRLTSSSLASVGTVAYDLHGNTTSIFGETRTYDVADRHLSTVKGTTNVTYTRDALDRIIERKVNGTVTARYNYSGPNDAPASTRTSANALIEGVYGLPGGVLLTNRLSGNVWSYPNIHGDVAAVANNAGAKQGATTMYDPFGGTVAGAVPDNAAGSFDWGWLGQHQRGLEQQAGLSAVIEMGARQYSPLLGRFLEVDPVPGGTTSNDYAYVPDPVNQFDLGGQCWGWGCEWVTQKVTQTRTYVSTQYRRATTSVRSYVYRGYRVLGQVRQQFNAGTSWFQNHIDISLGGCLIVWCRYGSLDGHGTFRYRDMHGFGLGGGAGISYTTEPMANWPHALCGFGTVYLGVQGCAGPGGRWSGGLGAGGGFGVYGY